MTAGARGGAAAAVVVLCCAGFLTACGTSGSAQSSAAIARDCQNVSAVLSDGPDPTPDPVGYAEAQILPLHQVRTSDRSLQVAIDDLDAAYRDLFSTNGGDSAQHEVAKASSRLDAICPGAAP